MSDARRETGIDLSLVQLLAGTGAALTAALLGSLFGIAGTLTGTAVGSAVATICTALYTHQLHRTRERLQRRDRSPIEWLRPPSWRALPWRRVLVATVVVFGIALTALTVVESLTGAPLSSATGRSPERDGGGTSLGRALVPDRQREPPVPRDIGSATPMAPTSDSSLPPPPPPSTEQSSAPPTQAEVPPPPGGGQLREQERASAEAPQGPPPAGRPSEPATSPAPSPSDATPADSPSPPPSVDSATDQPTSPPLPSEAPP